MTHIAIDILHKHIYISKKQLADWLGRLFEDSFQKYQQYTQFQHQLIIVAQVTLKVVRAKCKWTWKFVNYHRSNNTTASQCIVWGKRSTANALVGVNGEPPLFPSGPCGVHSSMQLDAIDSGLHEMYTIRRRQVCLRSAWRTDLWSPARGGSTIATMSSYS
jgi:hypothetical protein